MLSADEQAEVAEIFADQFASLADSRPRHLRLEVRDDLLRLDFSWPLEGWEALFLRRHEDDKLREFRSSLLGAILPSLGEVVEMATHRKVRSMRPHLGGDLLWSQISFALGDSTAGGRELEAGVRNWSEQVRRNARCQRDQRKQRIEELRRSTAIVRRTLTHNSHWRGRRGRPDSL